MNSSYKEIQNIFLVLLGAITSTLVAYLIVPNNKYWIVVILLLLSVIFLILGTQLGSWIIKYKLICIRYIINLRKKRIAILDNIKWGEGELTHTWTDIKPEKWKQLLEEYAKKNDIKIKVKLIRKDRKSVV